MKRCPVCNVIMTPTEASKGSACYDCRRVHAKTCELQNQLSAANTEIARLKELVKGQDDGGHWYSQQTMDAVAAERDKMAGEVAELQDQVKTLKDYDEMFDAQEAKVERLEKAYRDESDHAARCERDIAHLRLTEETQAAEIKQLKDQVQHMTRCDGAMTTLANDAAELAALRAQADADRATIERLEKIVERLEEEKRIRTIHMRVEEMTIEQLREVVRRLPLTADGVVVLPNMDVFILAPDGTIFEARTHRNHAVSENSEWYETSVCYSTREAADAAKEGKPC